MPIALKRLLATVLFADMVGYSRLMHENESEAIRARQKSDQPLIRNKIKSNWCRFSRLPAGGLGIK